MWSKKGLLCVSGEIFFAVLVSVHIALSAEVTLTGSVKSSDGTLLEGVAVSARAAGRTFTTTVYTDQGGKYFFPPLDPGHYRIWAQAIGFEAERAELEIAGGKETEHSFALQPIRDIGKQLSGSEWLASLPSDTFEDRRGKALVRNKCSSCHTVNFILQNRFDQDGWSKIVGRWMSHLGTYGSLSFDDSESGGENAADPVISAYQEELVDYLTKARGPNSTLHYKPQPRLTGESVQIVVTEYDIPLGSRLEYIPRHTGSIWSEGAPSAYGARVNHDIAVDPHGMVWFGDSTVQDAARTLGKLDPKTGHVTGYRFELANGEAGMANSGIESDRAGNIWLPVSAEKGAKFKASDGGGRKRRLVRFDPATEKFTVFPTPDPLPAVAAGTEIDSKGRVWIRRSRGGVFRFDPAKDKWEEFKLSNRSETPYGVQVDANDNVWYAMFGSDQIGFVDHRTGISSVLTLPPLETDLVTAKDREIALRTGDRAPLWYKGPRRMGADKAGDKLWVGLFYGDRLARIDVNSKEVKEYPLPHPDYTPYDTEVDKNHMVWISLMNSDRILKFDPFAEKFTEYPLPSVGTEARMIRVDNSTDPPTVWVAYWRTNRIARVQFRTATR